MHLTYRNANEAFIELVERFAIADDIIRSGKAWTPFSKKPSRVGEVIQIDEPVIITFEKPRERVLFNQERDCNPFFHVFETLWMLAGRNDIASLEYYSSGYKAQVDDGDGVANGAYGYRWRESHAFFINNSAEWDERYIDQLKIIIDHLKKVPNSRRAVLQMWNVQDDLRKIGPENQSKDVCCNTAAYFSLRKTQEDIPGVLSQQPFNITYLDMTVTNRSNDLIWGLLGSDQVNLSFLQEYIANCLGVQVGKYNQMSNNLHVYTERFKPEQWLSWVPDGAQVYEDNLRYYPQLVQNQETFDKEVIGFCNNIEGPWREPFLQDVARPMCMAFAAHKSRHYDVAINVLMNEVAAHDWRIAGKDWLAKRRQAWEAKQ